ncbi:MAG TPA: protein arginine kinase [Thermoguttaceae bacterium]|nr:protein arginine kinase [Thermoguttaceae bacterium]
MDLVRELEQMTRSRGEWLKGSGPESDIVISSRIRLARNLASYPFMSRATEADRQRIQETLKEAILASPDASQCIYIDLEQLDLLDRQLLVERQLISRELAEGKGPRSVVIDRAERFSLMINEEDHLRMTAMASGLNLEEVWQRGNQWDDWIEQKVVYAFDEKLGFLTACPTNVGTGIRVSVMLHLPALVLTRQIEKIFRSLQKLDLAVRGLHGEGSQATGAFYQISNQATLGLSEQEIMKRLGDIIPVIIDYERKARELLVRENPQNLHDRISRAFGILRTAQTISSEETMHLLSSVRMGVHLGLIHEIGIPKVNELFLQTQPAHLQKIAGAELDSTDRDIERARFLRRCLNKEEGAESSQGPSSSG